MPHSDIHGSKPARGSPWLFAACHVLHRLLTPRHPPDALKALDPPEIGTRSRSPDNKLFRQTKTNKNAHKGPGVPKGKPPNPGALTGNSDPQCQRPWNKAEAFKSRLAPIATAPTKTGGGDRIRTHDLKLAKLPLSQLSYAPGSRLKAGNPGPLDPGPLDIGGAAQNWWAREDSNFRPHAYQARALTN